MIYFFSFYLFKGPLYVSEVVELTFEDCITEIYCVSHLFYNFPDPLGANDELLVGVESIESIM